MAKLKPTNEVIKITLDLEEESDEEVTSDVQPEDPTGKRSRKGGKLGKGRTRFIGPYVVKVQDIKDNAELGPNGYEVTAEIVGYKVDKDVQEEKQRNKDKGARNK